MRTVNIHVAKTRPRRTGFLAGQIAVPSDFDRMGSDAIQNDMTRPWFAIGWFRSGTVNLVADGLFLACTLAALWQVGSRVSVTRAG